MPRLRGLHNETVSQDLLSWMDALSDEYVDGSALGFSWEPLLVQEEDSRKSIQCPKLSEMGILSLGRKATRESKRVAILGNSKSVSVISTQLSSNNSDKKEE